MSKTKVKKFLKAVSELSMDHGLLIEGGCSVLNASLVNMNLKDMPGRYKTIRLKGQTYFRWVASLAE